MNKVYLIYLKEAIGIFQTTKGQLNLLTWGIDAFGQFKNTSNLPTRVLIPWTSIDYIEEATS